VEEKKERPLKSKTPLRKVKRGKVTSLNHGSKADLKLIYETLRKSVSPPYLCRPN